MARPASLLSLFVIMMCLNGCGPSGPVVIPVSGVITLDGKPVENAAVMFVSASGGRPAAGSTNANGEYKLTTFADDDGCVLGKHRVSITLNRVEGSGGTNTPEGAVSGSGLIKTIWIIPEKYSDPTTSGLTEEISREHHRCDYALKSE